MSQVLPLGSAQGSLLPQQPGGLAPGAALALLVHAGLIAALTVSVDWRTQTPQAVSAELWASVPRSAAPPEEAQPAPSPAPAPAPQPAPQPAPPPPPPAPAPAPVPAPAPPPAAKLPEPDIAAERRKAELAKQRAEALAQAERELEKAEKAAKARAEKLQAEKLKAEKLKAEQAKAERDKLEREKADKLAKDKAAAAKRAQEAQEAKAEEERLAKQREENLKRMMGQAGGATGRSGTAPQEAGPSASYASAVAARIRRELVFTGNVPDSAQAEVLVRATASGTIIARTLTKSSGHAEWDEAVLRAIDKTGTLPRDVDGRVQSAMTLVFRRRE